MSVAPSSLVAARPRSGAGLLYLTLSGTMLGTGGLTVLHTPSHCAGQLCLLWPAHGGVLLAADAAANMFGLGPSVTYEDRAEGERQLDRVAALHFKVACFGHGKAIIGDAASRFRRRWPVGSAPDAEPGAASDRRGMSAFPDA